MTVQDLYQWFLLHLVPYKDNDDYGKRWIAFTALVDMFVSNRTDYVYLITMCSDINAGRDFKPYQLDWITEKQLIINDPNSNFKL